VRGWPARRVFRGLHIRLRARQGEGPANGLPWRPLARGTRRRIAARHAQCMVSRLDHPIQGVSLVGGITPQRIRQVGNEISAALELHIYSGPAFFGKLPRAHKCVVEVNEVANCEEQNGEDDKKYFHEMYSF